MILHDILAYKKAELAENMKRCGLEEMISLAEHEAAAAGPGRRPGRPQRES